MIEEYTETPECPADHALQQNAEYSKHVESAESINRGACMDWAEELAHTLGENGYTPELWAVDTPDGDMIHVWVYVNETGRHYDSEATAGVDDWRDLPIMKRVRENGGAYGEPRGATVFDFPGTGHSNFSPVAGAR